MTQMDDTIPYGFCHCGCGQRTRISDRTESKRGYVKGEPLFYIIGHRPLMWKNPTNHCATCGKAISSRGVRCRSCAGSAWTMKYGALPDPPNPSGLCLCGCGQPAPIAKHTNRLCGILKGHPVRYCSGHNNAKYGPVSPVEYIADDNGCWIWQRAMLDDGYGMLNGRRAHREIYERIKGKIPEGMELHHICEVRKCVNPEHLQVISKPDHAKLHQATRVSLAMESSA